MKMARNCFSLRYRDTMRTKLKENELKKQINWFPKAFLEKKVLLNNQSNRMNLEAQKEKVKLESERVLKDVASLEQDYQEVQWQQSQLFQRLQRKFDRTKGKLRDLDKKSKAQVQLSETDQSKAEQKQREIKYFTTAFVQEQNHRKDDIAFYQEQINNIQQNNYSSKDELMREQALHASEEWKAYALYEKTQQEYLRMIDEEKDQKKSSHKQSKHNSQASSVNRREKGSSKTVSRVGVLSWDDIQQTKQKKKVTKNKSNQN